ncbi:DUF2617 family protein [Streptomyces sp. DSM 44917]|uniref:DUF2617 family protein n=1 Tax=Streptomyces boetiae TaxID=3075541 RepID=A0ABU2LBT0_9ACTN|nr:DUF2617 family protein [Streptomyces sp. DSM 44917]MDT0308648.1 DUF2617 family protein [Streptomyces sp. DSM 44917]
MGPGHARALPLATPYLDTRAEQLSFALGLPAQRPLATAEVQLDGITVELRLLGASHQVFAGPVRETLACLAGRCDGGPPAVVDEDIAGWRYRFTSRVRRLPAEEFSGRAGRLRGALAGRPGALCGVFPGSPDALTALAAWRAADHLLVWRTWHAYPQTGQIVETRTRIDMEGAGAA